MHTQAPTPLAQGLNMQALPIIAASGMDEKWPIPELKY
jgi:hypothetical protein